MHLHGRRATSYPHVVGHDGTAVVTAVGAGVTAVSVGWQVTIAPRVIGRYAVMLIRAPCLACSAALCGSRMVPPPAVQAALRVRPEQ
ncbi:MAG: alcohol dehydrogenase catalytic domain-containing protein [Pseudonocardia sp.]|nr:alcohol dehydrogenase catalytic domain-containing protein [Pseudonocardia sp.]MBO0877510.1 alcohol dehydrogenase catalytic domain-containing protein [Pseudonocardia sp.]